ncbi:MAG: hypothetical protein U0638_12310 [Phycisphaerales bacterium]
MNHGMKCAIALLIASVCVFATGCPPEEAAPVRTVSGKPSLVLTIFRYGNEAEESRLVCALWSDGLLYFPLGEHQLFYQSNSERLAAFRKYLDEGAGIHTARAGYAVPDAQWTSMQFVSKDTIIVADWDEELRPNWGANINASDEYRAFVAAWYDTRVRLVSLGWSIENSMSEEERARRIEQAGNWRP